MRFLIAGFGSIGRRHFRNLLALGERDIVLYRTHKSTLPDQELAGFPVETDLQAALSHQPQAVIVANPTALHLDVAIPAARAGCTLLLEKPISHSLQGVEELREAVRAGGGQVLVGFQFRFHPALQQMKTILAERGIGRPLSVRAHWGEYLPGWHPWENYRQGYSARPELGGGVVLTLCHPLDYLRYLLGEVNALWAFTASNSDLDIPVEDTAEIGLKFESGVVGSIHLDYVQRPPVHKLEMIGTHGTMRWEYDSGKLELFNSERESWQTFGLPENFERNTLFLSQMAHFLEVLRLEITPLCTMEDGIRALELALAVHDSAGQGKMIAWK